MPSINPLVTPGDLKRAVTEHFPPPLGTSLVVWFFCHAYSFILKPYDLYETECNDLADKARCRTLSSQRDVLLCTWCMRFALRHIANTCVWARADTSLLLETNSFFDCTPTRLDALAVSIDKVSEDLLAADTEQRLMQEGMGSITAITEARKRLKNELKRLRECLEAARMCDYAEVATALALLVGNLVNLNNMADELVKLADGEV